MVHRRDVQKLKTVIFENIYTSFTTVTVIAYKVAYEVSSNL